MNKSMRHLTMALYAMLITLGGTAHAAELGAPHKIVIQVSTNDIDTQNLALNNAVNLQKHYGMDNVQIEIVAYGPGLSLFTSGNELSQRVASLAVQEIKLSACGNTIDKLTKKSGKAPDLTAGVGVVPAGVVRIMELHEQGYTYLRP